MHTYTHVDKHMHTCMQVVEAAVSALATYIHAQAHTYKHAYMHAYMHTCMQVVEAAVSALAALAAHPDACVLLRGPPAAALTKVDEAVADCDRTHQPWARDVALVLTSPGP